MPARGWEPERSSDCSGCKFMRLQSRRDSHGANGGRQGSTGAWKEVHRLEITVELHRSLSSRLETRSLVSSPGLGMRLTKFHVVFKILHSLFSNPEACMRNTQNFAPCEHFPLYGTCNCCQTYPKKQAAWSSVSATQCTCNKRATCIYTLCSAFHIGT